MTITELFVIFLSSSPVEVIKADMDSNSRHDVLHPSDNRGNFTALIFQRMVSFFLRPCICHKSHCLSERVIPLSVFKISSVQSVRSREERQLGERSLPPRRWRATELYRPSVHPQTQQRVTDADKILYAKNA